MVNAVMIIQSYIQANKSSVRELEINPLIIVQNGAVAVDALIRL